MQILFKSPEANESNNTWTSQYIATWMRYTRTRYINPYTLPSKLLNLSLINTRNAAISWDSMAILDDVIRSVKCHETIDIQGHLKDNMSIFVSTVLANDWAPLCARAFAGRVITKFVVPRVYMGLAFEV